MNFEKHSLLEEQYWRKSQLLHLLSSYCRRYRLAEFDTRQLPEIMVQELASEVLDFFEQRVCEELGRGRPDALKPKQNTNPK